MLLPSGAKVVKTVSMDYDDEFGIRFSYAGPLTTKQVVEYVFFKNRPRVMAGGVVTRNHVAERGDWRIRVTTGDATFSVSSSVYYHEYYATLYYDN